MRCQLIPKRGIVRPSANAARRCRSCARTWNGLRRGRNRRSAVPAMRSPLRFAPPFHARISSYGCGGSNRAREPDFQSVGGTGERGRRSISGFLNRAFRSLKAPPGDSVTRYPSGSWAGLGLEGVASHALPWRA